MSRKTWQRPARRTDAGRDTDGLAERVRQALRRLKTDMRPQPTNAAIAAYVGLPERWVQRYFIGARGDRATLDELDALCRYFNVRLGDVLIGASPDLGGSQEDARWSAMGKALLPSERAHIYETIALLLRARKLRVAQPVDERRAPTPPAHGATTHRPDDRHDEVAATRPRRRRT